MVEFANNHSGLISQQLKNEISSLTLFVRSMGRGGGGADKFIENVQ